MDRNKEKALRAEIERLKSENEKLRGECHFSDLKTVNVPETFRSVFKSAQEAVGEYFEEIDFQPEHGTIEIHDERYVLLRASSLSVDFLQAIRNLYADRPKEEAIEIGRNFLFDIAHLLGMEDAKNFHRKMKLKDPLSKLSAGPVHFAYTGWAFVDILPESNPTPDEHYYLKYHHPYSFEADTWIKENKQSDRPVCIMNAGYSSGWCEQSYGIPLTAVEISCKAKGDDNCTFIMAPPDKIEGYLEKEFLNKEKSNVRVPAFFERKLAEEKLKASLREKDILLQEIHHRVKNNLQIITSLLNLQAGFLTKENYKEKFDESIDRIKAMALIHEMLYGSENIEEIDFSAYIERMLSNMHLSYDLAHKDISLVSKIKIEDNTMSLDNAIPCALILNELVSNAIKHAFPNGESGEIRVFVQRNDEGNVLEVSDNGIGLPENFNISETKGLGLELIQGLCEQIEGQLSIKTDNGTSFRITF